MHGQLEEGALDICAFCYMLSLFCVMLLHRSMLNLRGVNVKVTLAVNFKVILPVNLEVTQAVAVNLKVTGSKPASALVMFRGQT